MTAWARKRPGLKNGDGDSFQHCLRCDRLELPEGLAEFERTADFTAETVPAGLLKDHGTEAGVWGRIHVLEGRLAYVVYSPEELSLQLAAGDTAAIAPRMRHRVMPGAGARFYLAFYKKP